MKPRIAVGYIRCSTEMQEDSPDQQKAEIIRYSETNGFAISEWFVDFGKSGTTFDQRPEFQRLRKAVENRPDFIAVICYDESRWGRAIDAEENTYWRVYFRKLGIDVLLVKSAIDPKHEFAPLMNALEGVQASQYSKKLSVATFRGASSNGPFSSGGTAPYGYKRIAVNTKTGAVRELEDGEHAIRYREKVRLDLGTIEEVETVRFIFKRRKEGLGYVLIAKEMNNAGVQCAKRGRWRNKDQKWSGGTIKSILNNPVYYGSRVYNRNSMSKIRAAAHGRRLKRHVEFPHWQNDSSDWFITENAHPAIVDRETWDTVNLMFQERKKVKQNQHSTESEYLLTSVVRCATCGFTFRGNSVRSKGRIYRRYVDGGWEAKRVCSYLAIRKERLEAVVIRAIKEVLLNPDILSQIEAEVERRLKEDGKPTNQAPSQLRELERQRTNITRAVSMADDPSVTKNLVTVMKELEARIKELQDSIIATKSQNQKRNELAVEVRNIREFLASLEALLENAPVYERKILIQKCVSEVIVDRQTDSVTIAVREWPLLVLPTPYKTTAPTTEEVVGAESSGGRT